MSGGDHCRSCGAAIMWVKSPTGANLPLDDKTVTVYCIDDRGKLVDTVRSGRVSHFTTCPNATGHSGKPRGTEDIAPAPPAPAPPAPAPPPKPGLSHSPLCTPSACTFHCPVRRARLAAQPKTGQAGLPGVDDVKPNSPEDVGYPKRGRR